MIFSNAALQWIPDHDRARSAPVRPGRAGRGARIPDTVPCVLAAGRVHRRDRGATRPGAIADDRTKDRADDGGRVLLLRRSGGRARSLDMWETEYHHVMDSPESIVDWISSTGLRPFLGALGTDAERKRFVEMLTERVEHVLSAAARREGSLRFPAPVRRGISIACGRMRSTVTISLVAYEKGRPHAYQCRIHSDRQGQARDRRGGHRRAARARRQRRAESHGPARWRVRDTDDGVRADARIWPTRRGRRRSVVARIPGDHERDRADPRRVAHRVVVLPDRVRRSRSRRDHPPDRSRPSRRGASTSNR